MRASSSRGRVSPLSQQLSRGSLLDSPASRAPVRGIVVVAAAIIVLAVSWYDWRLGLFLFGAIAILYVLHLFVVYLTDAGLLWHSFVVLGCLAIGLWPFVADRLDLRTELEARTPAPVWRLIQPVVRRLLAGGDMVLTRVASPDAPSTFAPGAAGAGAGLAAGSVVHTGMVSRVPVAIALTSSSHESVQGDSVVFTVLVHREGPGRGGPAGRVDLLDGGARIATAALAATKDPSKAMFTVSSLAAGAHVLAARYHGGVVFAPATSATLVHTVRPGR